MDDFSGEVCASACVVELVGSQFASYVVIHSSRGVGSPPSPPIPLLPPAGEGEPRFYLSRSRKSPGTVPELLPKPLESEFGTNKGVPLAVSEPPKET